MRLLAAIVCVVVLSGVARAADPITIPFKVIEDGFKKAECTNDDLKDEERTEVEDLGGGLRLVEIYCWRAAYQSGSIFFVVDPKAPEKARLVRFNVWSTKAKKLTPAYSLSNPGYNAETKVLGMAHKGRGVGDCGEIGQWKWNGTDFVLTGYWDKPNCDGKEFDEGRRWQVYPPRR